MVHASNNQPTGDHHSEKSASKADRIEKKAENLARGEASHDMGSIAEKTKKNRLKQYESGNSGASGIGDQNGKFRSAKDILGDAVHTPLTKDAELKRDAAFKSKHGDPNELQGLKKEPQGEDQVLETISKVTAPVTDLFSKAASWNGPKEAIEHLKEVTGLSPEKHKEQQQKGGSHNIPDALNELGSALGSGIKTLDQMAQHVHPQAVAKDSHETSKAMRKGIENIGTYLGDKVGKNDVASIGKDAVGLLGEGWGQVTKQVTKAIQDRNEMTPIERGHLPGKVGAIAASAKLSELAGLNKRTPGCDAFNMPEVPKELQHLELQRASPELLDAMASKGRHMIVAKPGSDDLARLEKAGARGSFIHTNEGEMIVTLPENPTKIAALEEFLHGTQAKLGTLHSPTSEIEVKDFMLRHGNMLGLTENDKRVVQVLKQKEIQRFEETGYKWLGK